MQTNRWIAGIAGGVVLIASAASAEEYCREYSRNVVVGGRTQEAYGTACQRPDGSWQIMSESGVGGQSVSSQPAFLAYENNVGRAVHTQPATVVVERDPSWRWLTPLAFALTLNALVDHPQVHYYRPRYHHWRHDDDHHYRKSSRYKYRDHHGRGRGKGRGRHDH